MTWMSGLISGVCEAFVRQASANVGPFMVVGVYAGCSLALYCLTRGREFLVAGYASLLFLVPFL